ncbi:MAG: DegT/DnrJ/EryC1/StrS family aminotransferase [Candidatus Sumerlaeota bacterium]|nr:DegT/DnrJ/EryC1/StrS family aminotransferase [Candidatus Sumerlaeota bacterium]
MTINMNRRRFLGTTAGATASAGISCHLAKAIPLLGAGLAPTIVHAENEKPALLGGKPALSAEKPVLLGGKPARTEAFPSWPVIAENDEKAWMDVLRSRKWFRGYGDQVNRFEEAYAKLTGAKHCVAAANGTSALFAALGALEVGPGDEVILPPYTFVATLNVITLQYALPVFVDTDPETFQIDARKIAAAVTERTAAILPVHIGGSAADLDAILAVAKKRKLPVVEDACQAHFAEWRGRKVGTWGDAGCFSFQASKNLNCGEGGAILCNDGELAEKCYAFHNNCRVRNATTYKFPHLGSRGVNSRLTEFQAALLMSQMTRLEEQSKTRGQNAQYLTGMLKEIPGIVPAKMYEGCTRNAYHLYMFRYQSDGFAGLPRAKFLKALGAEGVPCMSGYSPLNKEPFVKATLKTRAYQKIYPPEILAAWEERTQCPVNDQLCQEAVWFTQTLFLGSRSHMEQIAEAIRKIQAHAAELGKA